ncbi:MAG: DeoR family transcriptional regulator [Chitinivibrionales bacterium]|nr:DeoR family transcriptional regulator [Chitinivibrionales bacterium]
MLAHERRTKIYELMKEEGAVRTAALSDIFGVSEVTIRQDLDRLAADGLITREHGGAYLNTIPDQVARLALEHSENMDKKGRIGAAAAALVRNGERIVLDAGSTTTEVARAIQATELTVITNALNIALLLGSRPGISVMVTGGDFKAPTLSLTGEKAAAFFEGINVDKVFLATAGADLEAGLTYPGFADLPVKRAMIAAAYEVYLVADSTKIGRRSLATLGGVGLLSAVITDDGIGSDVRAGFENAGVRVIVAR